MKISFKRTKISVTDDWYEDHSDGPKRRFKVVKLATFNSIKNEALKSKLLNIFHKEAPFVKPSDNLLYAVAITGAVYLIRLESDCEIDELKDTVEMQDIMPGREVQIWRYDLIEVQYPSKLCIALPIDSEVIEVSQTLGIMRIRQLLDGKLGNDYNAIMQDMTRLSDEK